MFVVEVTRAYPIIEVIRIEFKDESKARQYAINSYNQSRNSEVKMYCK